MSDIHKKLMILQRASIGANDAQAEEMMGEIEEAFAELQAKVDEVVTQLKAKVKALAKLHDARFAALEEAEAAQTRVKELEAENAAILQRAESASQLACDLRSSQDEVIERCAKAVEGISPEAAERLRAHCGRPEDAKVAVSGEDFGELRRENARLRAGFLAAIERPKGVVPAGFEDLMKTE